MKWAPVRVGAVVVIGSIAGCDAARPPLPNVGGASLADAGTADAAVIPGSASPTPESLCGHVDEENNRATTGFPMVKSQYAGQLFDVADLVRESCHPTPGGAWAALVTDLCVSRAGQSAPCKGGAKASGTWSFVHVDRDGHRIVAVSQAIELEPHSWWSPNVQLFDYDGDGEPEALVLIVGRPGDGQGLGYVKGKLLTFRDGVVRDYSDLVPAPVGSDNYDADHRPDLFTDVPFTASGVPFGHRNYWSTTVHGPVFLAHSLKNGSFSLDDAVAQKVGREQCPAKPVAPFVVKYAQPVPPDVHADDIATLKNLRCARLWGIETPVLEKAIAAECRSGKSSAPATPPTPSKKLVCDLASDMYAFARATPPYVLKPE